MHCTDKTWIKPNVSMSLIAVLTLLKKPGQNLFILIQFFIAGRVEDIGQIQRQWKIT